LREWESLGEEVHLKITEDMMKDRLLQEQMKEQFTNEPEDFRNLMMGIEATVQGLRKVDDGYLDTGTQQMASEGQMEKLTKATDDAMLRLNPKMAEYELQYKDGFFIPLDVKTLIEKEKGGL
tara:strand:- start:3 stop:368 length:366 start_codon:yes stop_codon:yes gene_type:complete